MSMSISHAVKQAAEPVGRSIVKTGLLMTRILAGHIAHVHQTRTARRRLCDLDDRTLRDIGLCRSGLMFYEHREAFHEMNEISQQPGRR